MQEKIIIGKGVSKNDMEEFYTIKEVGHALKLSRMTLYRYVKEGLLRAIKVNGRGQGGVLRFRQKDIDAFAKKFTYQAKPA